MPGDLITSGFALRSFGLDRGKSLDPSAEGYTTLALYLLLVGMTMVKTTYGRERRTWIMMAHTCSNRVSTTTWSFMGSYMRVVSIGNQRE